MGYFIGIELSAENKAHAVAAQDLLRNDFPEVTWLADEQLFCVLCYFPVDKESKNAFNLRAAEKTLNEIGANVAPILISLSAPGCFPATGPARVAWIGIGEIEPQHGMLERLVSETGKLMARDFATKGELIPHIPIGRASDRAPKKDLRKRTSGLAIAGNPQEVARIALIESSQGHKGPVYKTVKSAELSAQFWG